MDRDQGAAAANLLDRENRIVADVLSQFRDLVVLATEPIDNTASAGQAAYSSMAMEIETKGLIKSTEDLLQLTRLIRELWVSGPLRKPGESEREADALIGSEVGEVVALLNRLREQSRQQLVADAGGHGRYVVSEGGARSGSAVAVPRVSGPAQTGQ